MLRSTPRLAVTAWLACLLSSAAPAQSPSEYEVKAAILYNLAKFVEWPQSAFSGSKTMTFCILGEDPFGEHLEKVIGNRTIRGRRIVLKYAKSVEDLPTCHVLFISSSEKHRLSAALNKLQTTNTLLVSDIHDFAKQGGTIGMVRVRSRVRFEVNRAVAVHAKLRLSSRFLRIARIVENGEN